MLTPVPPHERLVHKLGAVLDLSDAERNAIENLPISIRSFGPGTAVVAEGAHPTECCLVIDGLTCANKTGKDGVLQITSVFVPGDIPDLQSLHLGVLDHALTSLTKSRLGFVSHKAIKAFAHANPRLGDELWRETLVQAAIYADWVVNLGGRNARARVAHLFCEMHTRLKAAGLDNGASGLGLTQVQVSEATGLSTVHVNRVMQGLRAEGLVAKGRLLTVPDWARLAEAAQFDPAYLHIRRQGGAGRNS